MIDVRGPRTFTRHRTSTPGTWSVVPCLVHHTTSLGSMFGGGFERLSGYTSRPTSDDIAVCFCRAVERGQINKSQESVNAVKA